MTTLLPARLLPLAIAGLLLAESYTRMGNATLAADARRVLQQNDPQHPWLAGDWPKGKGIIARLNPLNGN